MADSFIRLSALGLYEEHLTATSVPTTLGTITTPAPKEKTYELTEFGRKLQDTAFRFGRFGNPMAAIRFGRDIPPVGQVERTELLGFHRYGIQELIRFF